MKPTPSQTIGPFFHHGLEWLSRSNDGMPLSGRVLDGAGAPVTDALVVEPVDLRPLAPVPV